MSVSKKPESAQRMDYEDVAIRLRINHRALTSLIDAVRRYYKQEQEKKQSAKEDVNRVRSWLEGNWADKPSDWYKNKDLYNNAIHESIKQVHLENARTADGLELFVSTASSEHESVKLNIADQLKHNVPADFESDGVSWPKSVRKPEDEGSFYFNGGLESFDVHHKAKNNSEPYLFIKKQDDSYLAQPSKLSDEKYLKNLARLIVDTSPKGSEFTIHIPPALKDKSISEQKKFVETLKRCFLDDGVSLENINTPEFNSPRASFKEDKVATKEGELKARFLGYIDKSNHQLALSDSDSGKKCSVYLQFDKLCLTEGQRVLKDMLNSGVPLVGGSPESLVNKINEYIAEQHEKGSGLDSYYGVIAIEDKKNGSVAFRVDSAHNPISEVFGKKPTEEQVHFISCNSYRDAEIDDLVKKIIEKSNANKTIQQESFLNVAKEEEFKSNKANSSATPTTEVLDNDELETSNVDERLIERGKNPNQSKI